VSRGYQGTLKNPHTYRKEWGAEFPVLWSGLVSRVGASHRVSVSMSMSMSMSMSRSRSRSRSMSMYKVYV